MHNLSNVLYLKVTILKTKSQIIWKLNRKVKISENEKLDRLCIGQCYGCLSCFEIQFQCSYNIISWYHSTQFKFDFLHIRKRLLWLWHMCTTWQHWLSSCPGGACFTRKAHLSPRALWTLPTARICARGPDTYHIYYRRIHSIRSRMTFRNL